MDEQILRVHTLRKEIVVPSILPKKTSKERSLIFVLASKKSMDKKKSMRKIRGKNRGKHSLFGGLIP